MARPLSEEKRVSILDAATVLIAEQGLNVSTSKIARLVKVSEGTIFTYFQNKDELINQLYLDIKEKLRESLVIHSQKIELQKQVQEVWKIYIN
ncbi:TetR/AcrR family transcriptional regulator [Acinetobacter nectaris]|uniref:TetR/AcrR family transcriptional regulator n=1 Tax=Acinetobacter nectaris TaxID=1219382 RepID=UPI001F35C47E|nr:helix-turn-helix domain-containing protein [Acinetobacter nectaris]MCF9046953.1 helix-turn-helix transcriptional regulator [Acinetobacter nectaris]